jgi:predicted ATP-dependent serine protease
MKEDVFEKLFGGMKLTSVVLHSGRPGEGKSHALLEMAQLLPEGTRIILVTHDASATR